MNKYTTSFLSSFVNEVYTLFKVLAQTLLDIVTGNDTQVNFILNKKINKAKLQNEGKIYLYVLKEKKS